MISIILSSINLFAMKVTLPVENWASYQFICYKIKVLDLSVNDSKGVWMEYPGQIKKIYYGYTSLSREDYQRDNDVPFENENGEFQLAGILYPQFVHNGGYKGAYVLVNSTITFDIPNDKNIVFKLEFDEYFGNCFQLQSHQYVYGKQTKTYFMEILNPKS